MPASIPAAESSRVGAVDATVEARRLADHPLHWRAWGPYLSDRAWGTVREDYSENGTAWEYFPHDHARSRAYRWNEDGLGGISDEAQFLCFAWSFWNGRDEILKERIFGLTGNEGNHGEDAKEYWWNLDSTPTHSWMRWRYWYPQNRFPYEELVAVNRMRTRDQPEYELLDTGIFDDDRYWDIEITYAKADADDICIRMAVTNRGPEADTLHVLPTLWFRNTWAWGRGDARPTLQADGDRVVADHAVIGRMVLVGETRDSSDGVTPLLVCENDTNGHRLFGLDGPAFPKDGIADHVLHGAATVVPSGQGTKAAFWHQLHVEPGASGEVRLRFSREGRGIDDSWDEAFAARERDANEFYAALTPPTTSPAEADVLRQALGGMLWSKQYYGYDVDQWLDGDPSQPTPPAARKRGRNRDWRHLNNADVISMPDTWEYPWYATWDLAFHCVALAHVDADFAKRQLLLMCREWYMHPNGQLPAYEWALGDVNPPVQAWAALRVFEIDGSRDHGFLERMIHKLLINFTWWVNRKDAEGNNVFEGGFLGLDNIGPIDRSNDLPFGGVLEQADGTAWMAMYCLNLLEMSIVLSEHDDTYEDVASKFFEHFAYIATALDEQGLWDEDDGFYYDVLHFDSGPDVKVRARSMVGLLTLAATTTLGPETMARLPHFAANTRWFQKNKPRFLSNVLQTDDGDHRLLAVVSPARLVRLLTRMLDPEEFLSPHGLRALSRAHHAEPFDLRVGDFAASVGYEPGESTSGLFGGNSNWRGPIWFPVNYLLIEALRRYERYFVGSFTIEHPVGSGRQLTLGQIADDLSSRLVGLFLDDADGRRPVHGPYEKFHTDPIWHAMLPFHEYFHGDTGAGLGASHQTGWTGLVANLLINRDT